MWQGRRGTFFYLGLTEVAMQLWTGAPIHAIFSVSCRSPAWKEGRWQLWTMSWSVFPMWRQFWRTSRFWEKAWSKMWKLIQRNGLSETTERCWSGLSWSSLFPGSAPFYKSVLEEPFSFLNPRTVCFTLFIFIYMVQNSNETCYCFQEHKCLFILKKL